MSKSTLIIIGCFFIFSCNQVDKFLCGELQGGLKNQLDDAKKSYAGMFDLEPIPCETFYINVIMMKSDSIDTADVKNLHRILYDENKKEGWMSLHILDKDRQFLFTHSFNGKISYTAPSW